MPHRHESSTAVETLSTVHFRAALLLDWDRCHVCHSSAASLLHQLLSHPLPLGQGGGGGHTVFFWVVKKGLRQGKQEEKREVGGKRWRDGWRRTKEMGRRRKGIHWRTKVNIEMLIRGASMMPVSPSWKREKLGPRKARWFRGGNITTTGTGGISFTFSF